MSETTSVKRPQPPLIVDKIKQQLRARIGTAWRIGDRLPPINVLARQMNVGEKNAYRAVRALADEGLLASRPSQGTFVINRPRLTPPAKHKRHVIHVPLGPERDGMIQRMGRALINELQRRGRDVRLVDDLPESDKKLDLRNVDADAVVLFNPQRREVLMNEPGPVLSLLETAGRPLEGITRRYDLISPDSEQGGLLAGEFMHAFDMTDVGFIGVRDRESGTYSEADALRLAGFERGFGVALPPERRFYVDHYSEHAGALFARTYSELKSRPKTMFFSSDEIAAGFVIGGMVLDLQHRRDYTLIGFDGQSRARSVVFGGITTVAVPAEAMGRQAAEFLDMRLEHPDLPPRSISLGCAIRRGKTTPKPTEPHHPFRDNDAKFWPAPPVEGEKS